MRVSRLLFHPEATGRWFDMPVSLKSSGGGSVTLDVPSTASTYTLTLPAATGTVLQSGTAVTVAQGGTGLTTLTANNVVLGNGTGTPNFVAPGTNGNVLTSNGTTWTSTAPSGGGQIQSQLFTSSSSWTAPTGVTRVRATVVGGGGGARQSSPGGIGGLAIGEYTVTPGTSYTVTIGTGGAGSTSTSGSGGTSSFGAFLSATGGSGNSGGASTNGTGSSGTLRNNTAYVNNLLVGQPLSGQSYKDTDASLSAVAFSINNRWMAGAQGRLDPCGVNFSNGGVGGAIFLEWVGA